ncbi:ATP-binding cassette domain-containing protein [Sinorhizobium medicae]|uniref:ABC transporter ATP-binding protein n=1 Tax=Sinorhizobium medicae TaxID=110321 RepID=UPI001295B3D4|nr:ABC transporter ATP-binding protein [Sinorhizobium medicae]MQW02007.1 ATP-binding cassette domain-containing protein [Sinorhizobium medicae]
MKDADRRNNLIQLKNVCKIYGAIRAVSDVSLEVEQGKTLALVGESGSGKSTTAHCLCGLVVPTSGEITVDGKHLLTLRGRELRDLRRRIGVVFQNPYSSLNPRMRVGKIIGEAVALSQKLTRRELRDAVIEHLVEVGLSEVFFDRFPHALSGGQRQRVAIARALALQPEILVLDEPTSALDVSVQANIMNLLSSIKAAKGLTYIFISHNLAVVESIADTVAVMRRGEVVEYGEVGDVLQNPKHEYTRLLLDSVMSTDPDWQFVPA